MVQTLVLDSIAERARDRFLARYFFKALRAPFAGDYLIGHEIISIAYCRLPILNVQ